MTAKRAVLEWIRFGSLQGVQAVRKFASSRDTMTIKPIAITAILLCSLSHSVNALADATSDIRERSTEAMENFDLLEFDEAKRLLQEALQIAKRKKLRTPLVASVYINLGVVYFSGFDDADKAKAQFVKAVEIDNSVDIDAAYRTAAMARLLKESKTLAGVGGETDVVDDIDDVDCASIEGLAHELLEVVTAGQPATVTAHLGSDTSAQSVHLYYRTKGSADFVDVTMKKRGECQFVGKIPAEALSSDIIHYYVAALSRKGKRVSSRGSAGSPNIIEVQAAGDAGFGDADDENPLSGSQATAIDSGEDASVSSVGPIGDNNSPKLFLTIAAGSGAGYVNGETEQVKSPVGCCVAPAFLHVLPELGYFLNQRMAIALAFRLGFPIGANRRGHATAAPAALLRIHYSLSSNGGDGLSLIGALGGGLIRHTIKIEDQPKDMNVDTTASGPLLVGLGVNYVRALSGPMRFVLGINATAGVPVTSKFQGVKPGFALQVDADLGIMFAF